MNPSLLPMQHFFTFPYRRLLCFRVNVDAEKCHGWVNTLGTTELSNKTLWKAETEVLLISFFSCCQTCFYFKITFFFSFVILLEKGIEVNCHVRTDILYDRKFFATLFFCLSMAVCNQYQNSELSPANCLLVGGFCDSLELEDLTLHAFRIES